MHDFRQGARHDARGVAFGNAVVPAKMIR